MWVDKLLPMYLGVGGHVKRQTNVADVSVKCVKYFRLARGVGDVLQKRKEIIVTD